MWCVQYVYIMCMWICMCIYIYIYIIRIHILLWITKSIDYSIDYILMIIDGRFLASQHQTPQNRWIVNVQAIIHTCPKMPEKVEGACTLQQGAARHCIQKPKSQTGRQAPMPSCFSPKLPATFKTRIYENVQNPENLLFMPFAYWLSCHTLCSWKTSQSVIGSSPGHLVTACVVYNAGRSIVKPAGKASMARAFQISSDFNECSPLCHLHATTKVPCSKWCPQNSNESTTHQPAPYSWYEVMKPGSK